MKKQYQAVTAAEAVKVIKSGDHVHISSVSNVPACSSIACILDVIAVNL